MLESTNFSLANGFKLDSYEIQSILGIGGFGITYKSYDRVLKQVVAIKEYFPHGIAYRTVGKAEVVINDEENQAVYQYGLERFFFLFLILAKFKHPNIIRVMQFIQKNNTAYLVMDFESGASLAQLLKKIKTLDELQIVNFFIPILNGLKVIHEHSFLHRDIKPSNILIRENGTPVLIDFGSARQALNQQNTMLTAMVTPGYAPFEQYFNDEKQGAWTDLYSLGATVFHCMVGEAPLVSTKRMGLLREEKVDPTGLALRKLGSKYSAELVNVIDKTLQVDPKNRYQTVSAVLDAIKKISSYQAQTTLLVEPQETIFSKELIRSITANLAEEIGPIADTVIRKAIYKAKSIEELKGLLINTIPTEGRRSNFLKKLAYLPSSMNGSLVEKNSRTPNETTYEENSMHESSSLDQAFIEQAKLALLVALGPIANVLIKKATNQTTSRADFIAQITKQMTKEKQIKDFLKRMQR